MNQLTTSLLAALLLVATTYVQESTSFILSSTHHRHPSTSTTTAINAKKKGRQTNVPRPLPTGPPPQDIKWVVNWNNISPIWKKKAIEREAYVCNQSNIVRWVNMYTYITYDQGPKRSWLFFISYTYYINTHRGWPSILVCNKKKRSSFFAQRWLSLFTMKILLLY